MDGYDRIEEQMKTAYRLSQVFEAWGFRVIWDFRDGDICLVVRGPRRGVCIGVRGEAPR